MLFTSFRKRIILNIPKIDLASSKVVVFTAYIPALKHCLKDFWQDLSEQEKSQAGKFVNNELKDRYVLSHGLLRHLLSSYVNTMPENIYYLFNKFGKPFLRDDHCRLQFNMSHSKDCVVYVIALDNQVGIDIEWKNRDINVDEIADSVFTTSEQAIYQKLDKEEKFQIFYKIWVKKEAIVKAIGQGLSHPIKEMEIMDSVSSNRPIYITCNNIYHYQDLDHLLEDYVGAVAFTHPFERFFQVDLVTHKVFTKQMS